jgi:hypothetical protein
MTGVPAATNAEIARIFEKYMKLKYKPLGVYFSETLPAGKTRVQHLLFNRCIPIHALKAAKSSKISILNAQQGCLGGRYWAGFTKPPKGLAVFLANGGIDKVFGGRGERFKQNAALGAGMMRSPGPVKQPPGTKYIAFQRLRDIPDTVKIEYVLFFCTPSEMAEFATLAHYAHNQQTIIRAPAGSGCQSLLNFPLLMKDEPEPDAVMGLWDLFARRLLPKNILSLAMRRWFAANLAADIPQSFLGHVSPFTLKGELIWIIGRIKKWWRGRNCDPSMNVSDNQNDV